MKCPPREDFFYASAGSVHVMDNKGKIYTRTGDKGQTSLFGNTRVSKADERVDTYGTVDELNSAIGLAIAQVKSSRKKVTDELERIQNDLLLIGSTLANPENPRLPQLKERVDDFERLIDFMTEKMPELHNFILPGGGVAGAQLHVCRTLCRRVERRIVSLSQKEDIDDNIRMYFNRLSDLLFTMARYVNHIEKHKETIWKKENR